MPAGHGPSWPDRTPQPGQSRGSSEIFCQILTDMSVVSDSIERTVSSTDRVGRVLGAQGRGLGDQRQHLGAVVEVVVQLLRAQVRLHAGRGRAVRRQYLLGVLGQLVHVDHVGQRAELVEQRQQPPALQPFGQRPEEQHRDRGEDDVVDGALDQGQPVEAVVGTLVRGVDQHQHQRHHGRRHDQRAEGAGHQTGAARASRRVVGVAIHHDHQLLEVSGHRSEAARRVEAGVDPLVQPGHRVRQLRALQLPVTRHAASVPRPSFAPGDLRLQTVRVPRHPLTRGL